MSCETETKERPCVREAMVIVLMTFVRVVCPLPCADSAHEVKRATEQDAKSACNQEDASTLNRLDGLALKFFAKPMAASASRIRSGLIISKV